MAHKLAYTVYSLRKYESGERAPSKGFLQRLRLVLDEPIPSPWVLKARPRRLPKPTAELIGREQDLARIVDLFTTKTRLVSLVGAPGIGKTRLALEVAWTLDAGLEHGAWFIPLRRVKNAEEVPAALVEALGLSERGRRNPTEQLLEQLAGQHALLVLDNFEHVLDAKELVRRLLAEAPQLRALVTTREGLDLNGEARYPVPALTCPPASPATEGERAGAKWSAVELFVVRAQMVRPDFAFTADNSSTVAEICRRLDGLPLAIEIVAARSRVLPPEALLERLRHGYALSVKGRREMDPAEETLRDAIAWSVGLLDPDERDLFARLGVFAGSFTSAAVAAVCFGGDAAVDHTEAQLVALLDKGLLETAPSHAAEPRFIALNTIRDAMLEQRDPSALEHLMERHCAHYTALAAEAAPGLTGAEQGRWLARLSDERLELRAAAEWSVAHQPERAVEMAACLWRFYWVTGRLQEGQRLVETALGATTGDHPSRLRAMIGGGVLARLQGDYSRGRALLEAALAAARPVELLDVVAYALLNLGVIAENTGGYAGARGLFEEALAVFTLVADERGVGHALIGLGMVALDTQQAGAKDLFARSLAIFRQLSDVSSVALAASNLAWVVATEGDAGRARSLYAEALDLARQLGDERGIANTAASLGRLLLEEGDVAGATGHFDDALARFYGLGERRGCGECLLNLASVAVSRNDASRAAQLLAAAAVVRETIGAPLWPAEQHAHDAVVQSVRDELGDETFLREWTLGRAMTLEEAVRTALVP